jgi:hypothetical protein
MLDMARVICSGEASRSSSSPARPGRIAPSCHECWNDPRRRARSPGKYSPPRSAKARSKRR